MVGKNFAVCLCCFLMLMFTSKAHSLVSRNNHLVVLCHGLLGANLDLKYLSDSLEKKGYLVYRVKGNELHESTYGIKVGGETIIEEINRVKQENPSLQKISLIGNSMGGIYARYVAAQLYNKKTNTIADLEPGFLLTTVTPHLGVLHYTLLDEYHVPYFSFPLRRIAASAFGRSGIDMSLSDSPDVTNSLLYQMATNESYLAALKCFPHRRLYANLWNDFLVPFGTSGIVDDEEIAFYQQGLFTKKDSGILFHLPPPSLPHTHNNSSQYAYTLHPKYPQRYQHAMHVQAMLTGLNSVGWEKLFVYFPSFFPSAHNKIMAMTKFHEPFDTWLGYKEGVFLVDGMVAWIESLEDEQ